MGKPKRPEEEECCLSDGERIEESNRPDDKEDKDSPAEERIEECIDFHQSLLQIKPKRPLDKEDKSTPAEGEKEDCSIKDFHQSLLEIKPKRPVSKHNDLLEPEPKRLKKDSDSKKDDGRRQLDEVNVKRGRVGGGDAGDAADSPQDEPLQKISRSR